MKKGLIILGIILLNVSAFAQASFNASGAYSQNFGTALVAAWTNNTTFLGWYIDNANFQGSINITAAAPSNTGGQYMYRCNSGTDMKLGTRPSNGSGGGPCAHAAASTCGHGVGVRLVNNFSVAIVAINVTYTWHQFSLAENGNNTNGMFFSYQKGVTVSNITTGVWTNVAALNFVAPQNSAVAGSNQINGYPCTQTGNLSACFVINLPVGQEIMLRWWDANNSSNDPHLAIDNVVVQAYSDNICMVPMDVQLKKFTASSNNKNGIDVKWTTQRETNADYFLLEHSLNGVDFNTIDKVKATGEAIIPQNYKSTYVPENSQIQSYFRLKMVDNNGDYKYSHIITTNEEVIVTNFKKHVNTSENSLKLSFELEKAKQGTIKVFDVSGKEIYSSGNSMFLAGYNEFSIPKTFQSGVYLIVLEGLEELTIRDKVLFTN